MRSPHSSACRRDRTVLLCALPPTSARVREAATEDRQPEGRHMECRDRLGAHLRQSPEVGRLPPLLFGQDFRVASIEIEKAIHTRQSTSKVLAFLSPSHHACKDPMHSSETGVIPFVVASGEQPVQFRNQVLTRKSVVVAQGFHDLVYVRLLYGCIDLIHAFLCPCGSLFGSKGMNGCA